MKLSLPPNIYTPDQLQLCSQELTALAARSRGRSKAKLAEEALSIPAQAILEGAGVEGSDAAKVEELAVKLESLLAQSARITLTLAGPSTHALREELVAWLRTNLNPNLLVSFKVNPDIGGGMVVRTTNKIHDLSFRKRLLDDPAAFIKTLENV